MALGVISRRRDRWDGHNRVTTGRTPPPFAGEDANNSTPSVRWSERLRVANFTDPDASHTTAATRFRRPAGEVPRQALARPHARAAGRGRAHGRAAVRRPPARRHPAALRPAAGDGGRAAVVGGAQGAVLRHRRQAAGRARGGPSDRVRRLRGPDPEGELRRGRRHRLGPRRVGADRRSAGGPGQGQAAVRAPRLQAARALDPGEDQEGARRSGS